MNNPAIKYGLIGGAVSIVLYLIMYLSGTDLIFSGTYMFIAFVVYVLFMFLAGREERNSSGGYLSYGNAVKACFLAGLVMILLSSAVSIIITMTDDEFFNRSIDYSMEASEKAFDVFGVSGDQKDEMMETMAEQMEIKRAEGASIGDFLSNAFVSALFSLFLALIIAIFVKKKAPEQRA